DVTRLSDYQILQKQEELLGFQRKAYLSEFYPTLSLGANYLYNTQSNQFNLYTDKALNFGMSAVTLTLNIPIFDGGRKSAKVKQAIIDIHKRQEDIKDSADVYTMVDE